MFVEETKERKMIKTKMFYDKLTSAAEQLEKFCNSKEKVSREQIISVALSTSESGGNRILLVYEDKNASEISRI
jgi:hypothetical protein